MKKKYITSIAFVAMLIFSTSCSKDFLETSPTQQVGSDEVFSSVEGGQAVMDGAYRYMYDSYSTHDDFGYRAIGLANDLMGEDMVAGNFHWFAYDYLLDNNQPSYRRPNFVWSMNYKIIFLANDVIKYISLLPESDDRDFVLGQAYAMRGNAYTELIYQFAKTYVGHESEDGVPLNLEPGTEANAPSTVGEVYTQIVADFKQAVDYLDDNPAVAGTHMSHITGPVANGMLARVLLIMNNWDEAATYAQAARVSVPLMSIDQYQLGFDNYAEQPWMWGFEINDEQSTIYASLFSHLDMTIGGYAGLGYMPKFVSNKLYNSMEDGDIRKGMIVDETNRVDGAVGYALVNYKFHANDGKGFSADYVMMRPAEMLLIEAEAIARQGSNDAAAQDLLLELRTVRQTTPVASTNTGQALIDEILLERRIELWGEGFRLFDLKRTKSGYDRSGDNHAFVSGADFAAEAEDDRFDRVVPQGEIDANENYR